MTEDLAFALEKLADESLPLRQTNLAALSDVPRSQAGLFRAAWARFGPERRLELVRELVEQAETNVRLNFYVILRELLADGDWQVRKLAIEGLWEDNRTNLVQPLAGLLSGDPVAEVRAAAAISLGRFVMLGALGEINAAQAEQAEAALRAAWQRPGEVTEVRRRALEGLAHAEGDDVRQMIELAYYDEDELLRQSAVYAMGRSADRRWAKYVLAELSNRDVAMRFEAVVAAGELALGPAVDQLVRLLDDPDGSVRGAAATALGEIGGPAARRALQAALGSSDEGLTEAAEAALEQLNFDSGAGGNTMFEFQDQGAFTWDTGAEDEGEWDEVAAGLAGGFLDDDLDAAFTNEASDDADAFEYDGEDLDWLDEADDADAAEDDLDDGEEPG